MIIDTHTHFYDPGRPQGVPWPPADNRLLYRPVLPEHYRVLAQPHGITGTIVVEASEWLEDNQWVLDLVEEDPFVVGVVGHLNPGQPGFRSQLERFAAHPLFLGIRCGASYFESEDDRAFVRDLECLLEHDLELDVLISQQHIARLTEIARRLPGLPIVINHVAHVPIDGGEPDSSWIDAIQQAASVPNVYMKVSALLELSTVQPAPTHGAHYAPTLTALWTAFGEDRLIYGSNWPVCELAGDFATAFGVVREFFAAKGEQAAAKYWWRNAAAAYRYGPRG